MSAVIEFKKKYKQFGRNLPTIVKIVDAAVATVRSNVINFFWPKGRKRYLGNLQKKTVNDKLNNVDLFSAAPRFKKSPK